MIVSASYKTDIPAFYGAWFMSRLAAGRCDVANPYGGPPFRVSLAPGDVSGFVFWTRNPGPFAPAFDMVRSRGHPFVIQFTITGYPRALDAATVAACDAIEMARGLAREFGPRAVVWRYDPIALTSITPPDWHRDNFARLARRLNGATDEVVVSFAQIYRKTRRNLDRAAAAHGFVWRDPDADEKRGMLRALAAIAAGENMRLTLCGQPELATDGVAETRCIDAERLSAIAGREIEARRKPHRDTCGCWQSRDIGAYDTCPHGCVYCYAVENRETTRARHKAHDPDGASLSARIG